MEGESQVPSAGEVSSATEAAEYLKQSSSDKFESEEDISKSVGPQIHSNLLCNESDVIDGNGDYIPVEASLKSEDNHSWGHLKDNNMHYLREDHVSKLSTFSSAQNENSEPFTADRESSSLSEFRVVTTDPLENNLGETLPKVQSSLTEAAIGPSEEREDISDEELEPDIWAAEDAQKDNTESTYLGSTVKALEINETPADTNSASYHNDIRQSPCDDRDPIDMKFKDAEEKNDAGSRDDHQQSRGPNEDLETVSDDELSEAVMTGDLHVESAFKLIEGGEQVSSSEDEGPASPDNTYAAPQQELPQVDNIASKLIVEGSEFSYGNISSPDLGFKTDVSMSQLRADHPGFLSMPLAPLEAEPISDGEDLDHADGSTVDVEDGEAGEIHSPAHRSPVSFPEQTSAALLGEVEPISADESSDTDGELPSGDEDSLSKTDIGGINPNNNFLESIDSDEEGDLGPALSSHKLQSVNRKRSAGEYRETISDEDERLPVGRNRPKLSESSVKVFEDSHASTSPISKDTETEKRQTASNFNEHQEELDYEENEGDDGEEKSEEAVKPEKKEAKQAGEQGETGNSDKDEGELSDDDCEEGEIKEPGSKKPFVKPMCRFFQRGNCTWGINCRFLHPGINDKGNYQMIEIPGFKPVGVRSRIGTQGTWPEQPEEQIELPPPPVPDVPPVETAWERGLRIAKEQRKKASERKELESDFEDKRLNLSVDEERELNKENERMPKIIPKDPYYDPPEEDNYYQISRNPWQTGHYENFEVKYNRENSFSPSYREKPPMMLPPPPRFSQPYSPPVDKFGRDRVDRREPFRPEVPPAALEYPSAIKRPDEWTDPWRRSKSPQNPTKRKVRSRSRGRRTRRSVSDSSNSSRSSSGSSSGSSRSSRTFNSSTGSSSRSRSPEPAPPGVDRHDRYISPSREPPRSAVSIRGSGAYNNYDQNYRRMNRGYDHNRGGNNYNQRGGNRGNSGGFYNNNSNYGAMGGGPAGGYPERDMRERVRDDRIGRNNRGRSPPDRPLPYVRPRPKSVSSRSSSSRSRSRSRGRATSSRSTSVSSQSSSSSSSSAGSADSEHLYRDLGSPSKNPRTPSVPKRKRTNSHKDHSTLKSSQIPGQQGSQRRQGPPAQLPVNLDHIPHPRDPKPPLPPPPPPPPSGRPESKYASRNAPQAPIKAKDPLKVVGQKSNIKLTLLPKQQQSSLGSRPNPLDSPPHKRRLSELDTSPVQAPPAKRLNLPMPQTSALRIAIEKAAKIQIRQEKGKSPPPALIPQSLPSSSLSSNAPRARAVVSPQKQPNSVKSRTTEQVVAKPVPKAPAPNIPVVPAAGAKVKKSMSSRREELLKQLKAVEDAIARKKSKLQ